jgi:hypothetical protein
MALKLEVYKNDPFFSKTPLREPQGPEQSPMTLYLFLAHPSARKAQEPISRLRMMQIGTQKNAFPAIWNRFLKLGLMVIDGGKADKFSSVLSFRAETVRVGPSDSGFWEKS